MTDKPARVAVLDDYQGVALDSADWSPLAGSADVTVFREHLPTEDEVVEALQEYPVVVAMRERTPFPRSTLERLPRLRLLVTTGARNAAIDLEACPELGITVCGTGGSGLATAELTWALLLACARRLDVELANVRAGGWMTTLGTELRGRTLGVLGLGRLGTQVARVAQAFGMRVLAWSQHLTDVRCREAGAERAASLDQLLAEADFVTIHLVLSERTRGLIGADQLRRMKPTAWLVNTSRGPICDEAALERACAERWIAGAALDVFADEPLPPDHPLRRLDNVLATPHIGYVTQDTYRIWFEHAVEDIAAFLAGEPVRVLAGPSR
ncbi:D-2-hydroxyacid dehydrogenase family protein [Planosporangium mesophilum]|uniref:2-hydroxyacid dehydrogenase n=1 Tax=Planosporangium mesophilum TaxID=689768 RepID=A0A8J3T9W9_9ACTN|nr:D-2-hydroxyacid dehydrogenase family protein [Planosporangium mesophilum]NJC84124.1 D-2-hydroxyacid dehydrogenase family protein [Planosporangium mesophilum]GII22873.1 2-hydroxyacid dehydrogenase [Planosporangium mesophilum]